MSSITGLRPLKGTSIINTGFIALNNDLNQGTTGQVIKSNGPGVAVTWEDETIHPAQEPLTMGTNVTLTSGNAAYDGSIAEIINSTQRTNAPLTMGTNLNLTSGQASYDGDNADTINLDVDLSITSLQIGTGTTYTENMSLAIGAIYVELENLNEDLFTNGDDGDQTGEIQGGASFVASGDGTGGAGSSGFNSNAFPYPTPRYFLYTGNNTRLLRTKSIRSLITGGGTITIAWIQGNSSNGGENPDNNENLLFETIQSNGTTVITSSVISLGNDSYVGAEFSVYRYTLSAADILSGYYFGFRQNSSNGGNFDNYGIKYISFSSGAVADIRIFNLPTSLPTESGRVWNNNGILNIN
tara:strand:- start:1262 stop:2326 length:1065 start_codon:yes stop_codon:yes gene_type:complete